MIVRNEAHVVSEVLDCVAPYITTWVIVDTGSEDGTQKVILEHLANQGIPGELFERPWQNFGYNRSEALELAAGRADYIWVIDADDLVIGTLDFSNLTADSYDLRYGPPDGFTYWRPQLFRDGLPWRYEGVVHEFIACDQPEHRERLLGDYYIDSRRLGGRNLDPDKYARDRDLLLAEMERDPDDARSAFYLAQSYFDLSDFANARIWYERRAAMGGWEEEVYYSLFRAGESMLRLGEPWPQIQDVLLRAHESRPSRAEALYTLAKHYRQEGRFELGHLFASRAAACPLPQHDILFVWAAVHTWSALDEQAVCASQLGLHAEAFALCRRLLACDNLPPDDRARIAANRDFSVPNRIQAAIGYPAAILHRLRFGPEGDVTVSVTAGPTLQATEETLNSLLNSCTDRGRIRRLLIDDSALSEPEKVLLGQHYPFAESLGAQFTEPHTARLRRIGDLVRTRFWLHIGEDWRFFAPERLLSRMAAICDAEPDVMQVAVNFEDATGLTGRSAGEDAVRRGTHTGRYVITDGVAFGPAMLDTERLGNAGGLDALATMTHTYATLDEVLCVRGS